MQSGWTQERRERQREAIQTWQPWLQSSGPRSDEGKAASARNAYRGGQRQAVRELCRLLRELPSFI